MCAAVLGNKLKKMLGLEEDNIEEIYPTGELEEVIEDKPISNYKKKNKSNIIPMTPNLSTGEMIILEPKSFDEAATIVGALREGKAIIMNLSSIDRESAQRLVDFVAGATFAIDGHQQKVGDGIFIFTPRNIFINSLQTDQEWLNRENKEIFWKVK